MASYLECNPESKVQLVRNNKKKTKKCRISYVKKNTLHIVYTILDTHNIREKRDIGN